MDGRISPGGTAQRFRLDPDYGPFAAAEHWQEPSPALASLACPGEPLWIVEAYASPVPPGMNVTRTSVVRQMVMERLNPDVSSDGSQPGPLGDDDAADMRALALLTRPGPMHSKTHFFGGFVGVRAGGELIAMAGERMRGAGYAEVSGVCTHPDHRGRGHASRLMSQVAAAIIRRGEMPFLHAFASNAGAIALYESLGFRTRRDVVLTELVLA